MRDSPLTSEQDAMRSVPFGVSTTQFSINCVTPYRPYLEVYRTLRHSRNRLWPISVSR